MTENNTSKFKYWAFISYSHSDKAWGDWLHRALENYRVPKSLIGKPTTREELVPSRIFPVFRDREEMPTSVDLGEIINTALQQSRYLIVICSPASARSQWVNQEIIRYKQLGRENRVLAIIVDGEPNAGDGKSGFPPESECFPDALKFRLSADGQISNVRTEPIAADARGHADGKRNALLKLLAGVMGVNFDDLKRRDEQQRRRRQRIAFAIVSTLLVIFTALAITALVQWQEAIAEKNRANKNAQEADRQRKEAIAQRDRADMEAKEKELQRKEAVSQRDRADMESKEKELQRKEAVAQKDRAERHLAEALLQQGNNFLNQGRAEFAAHRMMEANDLASRALSSIPVSDGETRPLLPTNSIAHQAATLLKQSTDGLLLHQQSRAPFRIFFEYFHHDIGSNRFHGADAAVLRSYDLRDGTELWKVEIPDGKIIGVASSLDGKAIFAIQSGHVTKLDAPTGAVVRHVASELEDILSVIGGMGEILFAQAGDNRLIAIDTTTGKVQNNVELQGRLLDHAFSFDRSFVLVCDRSGEITELALPTLEVRRSFQVGPIVLASFAKDGNALVTATREGRLRRFDVGSGVEQPLPNLPTARPWIVLDFTLGELFAIDQQGVLSSIGKDGDIKTLFKMPVAVAAHLHVDRDRDHVFTVGIEHGLRDSNIYQASLSGAFTDYPEFGAINEGLKFRAAPSIPPAGTVVIFETLQSVDVRNILTREHGTLHAKAEGEHMIDLVSSTDGFRVAMLNAAGLLRVFDFKNKTNKSIQINLDTRSGVFPANQIALSDDVGLVYAIANEGIMRIELASAKQDCVLEGKFGSFNRPMMIARSDRPDRFFVHTLSSGVLGIYNVKTREFEQPLRWTGVQDIADVIFDESFVYVAAHGVNGAVLLVLTREGYTPVAEFKGHRGLAKSLLRLYDGRIVMTGENDLTTWNVSRLLSRAHIPSTSDPLKRAGDYHSAPDGWLHMPDNSYGDAVLEIDPATRAVRRTLLHNGTEDPEIKFTRRKFSDANRTAIILSDENGGLHGFDRATLRRTFHFPTDGEIKAMSVAQNTNHVTVLDEKGNVRHYDFTGKLLWSRKAPDREIDRFDRSFNDAFLIVNAPKRAFVLDARSGATLRTFDESRAVEIMDDLAVVKPMTKGLRCVSVSTGRELWHIEASEAVWINELSLVPEEELIIAGNDSGFYYHSLRDGTLLLRETGIMTAGVRVAGQNREYTVGKNSWMRRFGPKPPKWFAAPSVK